MQAASTAVFVVVAGFALVHLLAAFAMPRLRSGLSGTHALSARTSPFRRTEARHQPYSEGHPIG